MTDINTCPVSENAVLITWPEHICPCQHQQIMACQQLVKQAFPHQLIDTVASYNSLIIYYDFQTLALKQLTEQLKTIIQRVKASAISIATNNQTKSQTTIDIPVYYGTEVGWDLLTSAKQLQLTTDELVNLHCGTSYRAYALGFTPGFCYLGQLDKALQLPRKTSPRLKLPAGSVAIAQQQTAVYPSESPGGWHIIGRTPITMYQVNSTEQEQAFSPLIQVGDNVRFRAISKTEFLILGGKLDD